MAQSGETDIDAVIAITSANPTAAAWGPVAAKLLQASYGGLSPRDAALSVAENMAGEIGEDLRKAVGKPLDSQGKPGTGLAKPSQSTVEYAGEVGRACPLPQSMPVIFHICARARSYREAIETNILAGGDNCGRAPVLGAVFAAAYGVGGDGVPLEWLARVTDIDALTAEAAALSKTTL